jgi:hypothetical protein
MPDTRAQRDRIAKLKKRHGTIYRDGVEPDGETVRVHWAGDEPLEERTRVITPSGIAQEPGPADLKDLLR